MTSKLSSFILVNLVNLHVCSLTNLNPMWNPNVSPHTSLAQLCIRQIYFAMTSFRPQTSEYRAIWTVIFRGLGSISTNMLTWQFVTVLNLDDLVANTYLNNVILRCLKMVSYHTNHIVWIHTKSPPRKILFLVSLGHWFLLFLLVGKDIL